MTNIEEAVEFFTAFFDAEFKALEASLAGAKTFSRLHKQMQTMLSEPCKHALEIRRHDTSELDGDWKAAFENTKKAIAPRRLFLVEQHDLGVRKRLFGGFAGAGRRSATSYAQAFWADQRSRIVATYHVCVECDGLGVIGETTCIDCRGKRWSYRSGENKLMPWLLDCKPTAVKKLLRPSDPASAKLFDERA